MRISRLSTFSLTVAIAVFALGYGNPSFAKGKNCDPEGGDSRPKCDDDPAASGLTFMVEMDGAFAMVESTTSDRNELIGERELTMVRPGFDSDLGPGLPPCSDITDEEDQKACETWGTVFNVCDIYKIEGSDPYGPDQFTTTTGRKGQVGWNIIKYGGGVRVWFFTSIKSPIDLNPLDVTLRLTSKCTYHTDHLDDFPGRTLCDHPFLPEGTGNQFTFDMQHFWSHANGTKNIVHAELCHVGEGELLDKDNNPLITLTITAQ